MSICETLTAIVKKLKSIQCDIENILSDENDYMWNIPENLQVSDRYYAAEEAVENLESSIECIDEAIDELNELLEDNDDE